MPARRFLDLLQRPGGRRAHLGVLVAERLQEGGGRLVGRRSQAAQGPRGSGPGQRAGVLQGVDQRWRRARAHAPQHLYRAPAHGFLRGVQEWLDGGRVPRRATSRHRPRRAPRPAPRSPRPPAQLPPRPARPRTPRVGDCFGPSRPAGEWTRRGGRSATGPPRPSRGPRRPRRRGVSAGRGQPSGRPGQVGPTPRPRCAAPPRGAPRPRSRSTAARPTRRPDQCTPAPGLRRRARTRAPLGSRGLCGVRARRRPHEGRTPPGHTPRTNAPPRPGRPTGRPTEPRSSREPRPAPRRPPGRARPTRGPAGPPLPRRLLPAARCLPRAARRTSTHFRSLAIPPSGKRCQEPFSRCA